MSLQRCIVAFTGPGGIRHSAEVTAESLFEAAALALAAFREARLAEAAPGRAVQLEVSVAGPVVKHAISLQRLEAWLASGGKSPKEQAVKGRLRELLTEKR